MKMNILTYMLYAYSLFNFIGAHVLVSLKRKDGEDSGPSMQRFIQISLLSLIAALLSETA